MTARVILVIATTVAVAIPTVVPVRALPDPAPLPRAEAPAPSGVLISTPWLENQPPASVTEGPTAAPEAEASTPGPAAETFPIFKAEQLDQLLAPIAIYPDALLAQILMAATYPLEIVKADRWLQAPAHASLQGEQLAAAIEGEAWDPSVKSLVPFARILRMMDQELDWTEQLGDAVIAQQGDVMDSIQRLRHQAAAAEVLWSNSEQRVTTERQGIVIQPANPEFVYPPLYSPAVYGPWPYPDYPPLDISPSDYGVDFPPPLGIGFGVGFATVQPLWRWCGFDWGQRRIRLDVEKFNSLNHPGAGIATDIWRHDLGRRPSVLSGDPTSRPRLQAARGPAISAGALPRLIVPSAGVSAPTPIPRPAPRAFTAAGPPPTSVLRPPGAGLAPGGREFQARIAARSGLVGPRTAAPTMMPPGFLRPMLPRSAARSTMWAPRSQAPFEGVSPVIARPVRSASFRDSPSRR